jgi:hypothetical protein
VFPDDVLAAVLRRLAPRGVATSRCVCRAWCALIYDRHLLRTDLLPLSWQSSSYDTMGCRSRSSSTAPPWISRTTGCLVLVF